MFRRVPCPFLLYSFTSTVKPEFIKKNTEWEFAGIFAEMKTQKVIQFENMNPTQKARNKGI